MISVIIVQYNNFDLTKEAIKSFIRFNNDFEMVLVDNGSDNFSENDFKKDFPFLNIIPLDKNLGFSVANNIGAKVAKGDVLFFLNNDTVTFSKYDDLIIKAFYNYKEVGIIGPRIINPDQTLQLSHGKYPDFFREILDKVIYFLFENRIPGFYSILKKLYGKTQYTYWVTGAALFIRRSLFEELKGFDEKIFMYFEDKDLCKRALFNDKQILFYPVVSLIHIRGGSTASAETKKFTNKIYRESQKYYYKKHLNTLHQKLLNLYLGDKN